MALFKINTQPTDRQLRQFGVICAGALPLMVWVWTRSQMATALGAIVGFCVTLTGLVTPRLLKPVFVGLIFVTMPLGLVVGELILLLIFFCVFLPMAVVFKIMGRDALQRKLTPDVASFWQRRVPPSSVRKYYHQS